MARPRDRGPNRRMSFTLPSEAERALRDLAGRMGQSSAEQVKHIVIRTLSQLSNEHPESPVLPNTETVRVNDRLQILDGPHRRTTINQLFNDSLPRTAKSVSRDKESKILPPAGVVIRNRKQAIQYSNILITALQEILDYDPVRGHNRPPPELRIEEDVYLNEIRALINELKQLNKLLDARRAPKNTRLIGDDLYRHFNSFLSKMAVSFGIILGGGAGALLIGNIAALLHNMGFDQSYVKVIFSHLRSGR